MLFIRLNDHKKGSSTNLRTFARKFSSQFVIFKSLLQSDNELLVSEMQKKLEVTDFVSEINRVENYPDFEQLPYVIQHGLKEFIVIHFTIIHQRGGEQYLTNHL